MDKNTFSVSDGGATIGGFYPDIRNKKILCGQTENDPE